METDAGGARLYDGRGGVEQIDLDDSRIARRRDDQLVWIDLQAADDEQRKQAAEAVGLDARQLGRLLDEGEDGSVDDRGDTIGVHAFTIGRTNGEYERAALDIAAGSNWVITAHDQDDSTIDDFRSRLETSRRVGDLDGGSFVAFLLDWVFTRYMAEIESVDREVDELDVAILKSSSNDASLERIADLRRRSADIRRSLAAHREVVTWPAHTEFSDVMTERAQRHFIAAGERFGQAVASADTTRDSLAGSFDLLMSRVAQRTNDTVRFLTVVSVSLLPATLLAGIMGMNFHPSFFDHPGYFWFTLAAIFVMVLGAMITARLRHWV